ncbi:MAG: aminoacetone oxidase family FAD-binding enzyme [Prevotellaceae bacterium]|nr:aminoacetone oxidase family FAD-binding enzyme [Prevotellaceae bacterium]
MRTAVVGGGAAGFFLAVNLKEMMPQMHVCIYERSRKVLSKVAISGGGRCNCTNAFADVGDLSAVYPRGHRLMKRLMHGFDHRAAYAWFERHGVPLTTQDDGCVFPQSQDAQSVVGCLTEHARRMGVEVRMSVDVKSMDDVGDYDFVVVTTGGCRRAEGLQWLEAMGHEIETPVPSLFTFNIADEELRRLMGAVVQTATVGLASTKWRADGALLLTHWGMSGPAILRLSSYAARYLAERDYKARLMVNWLSADEETVRNVVLRKMATEQGRRAMANVRPEGLPLHVWQYLLRKCGLDALRWGELGSKQANRLASVLTADGYDISGRAAHKDEFVTCGGVSLASVHAATLESRVRPNLFFAGEVLDVDGVTGGFNFQAAWTTAYTVAKAICGKCGLTEA